MLKKTQGRKTKGSLKSFYLNQECGTLGVFRQLSTQLLTFLLYFAVSDDVSLADGLGMAVGPERFELLAHLSGNMVKYVCVLRANRMSLFLS